MQWGAVEGNRFNTVLPSFSAELGNWFRGSWAGGPQGPWKVVRICYWVHLQIFPRQLSLKKSLGWGHWLLIPSCHWSSGMAQCTCHSRKWGKMELPEASCHHEKLADYRRDGRGMKRKHYLLAVEGQRLWGRWGGKGVIFLRKGQRGWRFGGKGTGIWAQKNVESGWDLNLQVNLKSTRMGR